MTFASESETIATPDVLLRVPVGLSSPLWGLFAGAAMSGAAWWWMTRWAAPENLEALFGAAGAGAEAAVAPEMAILPSATPAIEAAVEAAVEAAPEPVIEAPPTVLAEALVEAPAAPEPVGGEAAPVSPVLEVVSDRPSEASAPKAKPDQPKPA